MSHHAVHYIKKFNHFISRNLSLLTPFTYFINGPPPVMPDVRIPEREERRLPRQCNSQKKGSLLLTQVRAPAAHPTQWYGVRER